MDAPLPPRGRYLIRDAYVITLDAERGDLPHGDVLVEDGEIVAVGEGLSSPGSEVLDGTGRILAPGLVDTHTHLWNGLLRGVIEQEPGRTYFEVKRRVARHYAPEESYVAARLGLADALMSGTTTVCDWDHNARSPEDVDAKLRAHRDSGMRTRYAYGNPDNHPRDEVMDLADVARVQREWLGTRDDGRLSLCVAVRGPARTERDILSAEWAFARDRGLPITLHLGGRRDDAARYADLMQMHRDGLLGPDVQVVHAVDVTDEEIAMLAATGTSVCLSPLTEYEGMGIPRITELLDAGVLVSLSVDTLAAPLSASLLAVMGTALTIERGRPRGKAMTARRMLELATIDGARDLGLDHLIGTITPGKRADLILVNRADLNMVPCADPLPVLVLCAQPANVDTVLVDGRVLKRNGVLTAVDPNELAAAATRALAAVLDRADWHQFALPALAEADA
ncbi:amidohydrolase family protein [Conexibacter woesei]|uniref:Amidohydrolase n=1 Tax=Conexibacter woesei (strain DSM 14684 / CCUG 47730 / CIP 108061 / JCM 11494 / NBRC 100937 / ID131577) TaxID=469383 RepID=D3F7V5_CONWI|nr:amidohydrolase family protein [Conexibacter woesei]ADB52849.1 amidohydrolase [Conexibacter woesei DSM 14684]